MKHGLSAGSACLALLVLSFAGVLPAQTPPAPAPSASAAPEQDYTISMDVKRVVLYVTVREGKSGFVGDLTKADFTVKDDGKVMDIRQFVREEMPAAIGVVIDNSQSMMNKYEQVAAAAKAFVEASNPRDEMFVVQFSDDVVFALPKNVPFTSDRKLLNAAIDRLQPSGQTALYDAINAGLERLKQTKLSKKALVVISDGGDNKSVNKMKDVVKAADLSGSLFYAIGIYDPLDGDADPAVLRRLARATGGEVFFPDKLEEVKALCESIAKDLRNQYMLVYAPPERPNDKGYHRLSVEVKDPKRRKLVIRTRTGYYGESITMTEK